MPQPRFDGIYYYQSGDQYFCYQFRESGVLSFVVRELKPAAIQQAQRFPARGSYVMQGDKHMKINFSRDTDIFGKLQADGSLDIVISSEYGDKLNERRLYQFFALSD